MEKRTPHYKIPMVKNLVESGRVRLTTSAYLGAQALGLNSSEVISVVLALKLEDFYKSVTTYADHRSWQGVYRPMTKAGPIYLKLMIKDSVLVVSFKAL